MDCRMKLYELYYNYKVAASRIAIRDIVHKRINYRFTQKLESGSLRADSPECQFCSSHPVGNSASTLRLFLLSCQSAVNSSRQTRRIFSTITNSLIARVGLFGRGGISSIHLFHVLDARSHQQHGVASPGLLNMYYLFTLALLQVQITFACIGLQTA